MTGDYVISIREEIIYCVKIVPEIIGNHFSVFLAGYPVIVYASLIFGIETVIAEIESLPVDDKIVLGLKSAFF